MTRPTKEPKARMDSPLMVMVTAEQKALIQQAAITAGSEMSAWIRPILLNAAKREIAKSKGGKSE
jgi:uncharacterized protein (DUF1778 family)